MNLTEFNKKVEDARIAARAGNETLAVMMIIEYWAGLTASEQSRIGRSKEFLALALSDLGKAIIENAVYKEKV